MSNVKQRKRNDEKPRSQQITGLNGKMDIVIEQMGEYAEVMEDINKILKSIAKTLKNTDNNL